MTSNQKYIMFNFEWSWIRDKQILHKGNEWYGTLIILDSKGNVERMYGYEYVEVDT